MPDLMQEESKCPICGGLGFIFGGPDGRNVSYCACYKRQRIEERIKKSGFPSIESCTFEAYKVENPWQKIMKNKAEQYLKELQGGKKLWLFMGGNPGCGKTLLCSAICCELLKNNVNVRYMLWLDVVHKIKAAINDQGYSSLMQPYLEADVLYIDDLFKGKSLNPSEADVKICFEILNWRYLKNLPTIISSEFFLDSELITVDEATFSRVCEKTGNDYLVSINRDPSRNYRLKEVKHI